MTEFAIDVLKFANRASPGGTAGVAKMFGKNVNGVSSLVVQSSDGVEHQLAPAVASAGGVPYSALANAMTLGGGATLADNTSPQAIFPAARDTITLSAGYYRVRGFVRLVRTGSGNGSTTLSFTGTATYGSVGIRTLGKNSLSLTANAAVGLITSAAGGVAIPASVQLERSFGLDGALVITAGGTCIPTITFSVAPGSTVTVSTISFLELVRVGADTFTQQGGWT